MTGEGRVALVTTNIVYPQALALDLANRWGESEGGDHKLNPQYEDVEDNVANFDTWAPQLWHFLLEPIKLQASKQELKSVSHSS